MCVLPCVCVYAKYSVPDTAQMLDTPKGKKSMKRHTGHEGSVVQRNVPTKQQSRQSIYISSSSSSSSCMGTLSHAQMAEMGAKMAEGKKQQQSYLCNHEAEQQRNGHLMAKPNSARRRARGCAQPGAVTCVCTYHDEWCAPS